MEILYPPVNSYCEFTVYFAIYHTRLFVNVRMIGKSKELHEVQEQLKGQLET